MPFGPNLQAESLWLVPAVAAGGAMAFNSLHRVTLSVLAAPIVVRHPCPCKRLSLAIRAAL